MDNKRYFYPEMRFGDFTDIDGTIVFYNRVNALLDPSFTVVDLGCGRGKGISDDTVAFRRNLRILKGKVKKVIGIDVDTDAQNNPAIDEFKILKDSTWPIEDSSVDLILCDNVLEHIKEPEKFFMETSRILKKDGYLCIRTPNRWGYVALISSIVPNRLHSLITRFVQSSRKDEDVFPTVYKCNSIRKIKLMMNRYGFENVVYGYEAEPSYLDFSRIAYMLGVAHQKFVPSFMKLSIFAFGKLVMKS